MPDVSTRVHVLPSCVSCRAQGPCHAVGGCLRLPSIKTNCWSLTELGGQVVSIVCKLCDSHSAKRTQVIDDESDYFTVHSQWLSRDEKHALKEREDKLKSQMHSRSGKTFTLDFADRKVTEEDVLLGA